MVTKTIKITNPMFVGSMAKLLQDYYKRIAVNKGLKCIRYETLYSYFANVVQSPVDPGELWVSFIDDEPIAFALWRPLGLPYTGIVHCEHLYNSKGTKKALKELIENFIEFGRNQNAPYYSFTSINAKIADHCNKLAKKYDMIFENTGMAIFQGRLG